MDVGSTQEWVSSVQGHPRREVSCASGELEPFSQCFPEIDNRKDTARDCASACPEDPAQARTATGVGQNDSGVVGEIDTRPSFCWLAASREQEDSIKPSSRPLDRADLSARTAQAVTSGLYSLPGSIEKPPPSTLRLRIASSSCRGIVSGTFTALSLFLPVESQTGAMPLSANLFRPRLANPNPDS